MINLKELFKESDCDCENHKILEQMYYDDAVSFYLDARDFPEKHPELCNMFAEGYQFNDGEYGCFDDEDMFDRIKNHYEAEWRDWLFKKIFEGGN